MKMSKEFSKMDAVDVGSIPIIKMFGEIAAVIEKYHLNPILVKELAGVMKEVAKNYELVHTPVYKITYVED
jgi:hypothetical protein